MAQLTSGEKALYAQLKTNYKDNLAQYQRYLKKEIRFQTELKKTVLLAKKSFLKDRLTTRKWLEAFKTTTKPDNAYIIGVVKAKYKAFISSKYQEWLTGSLKKWFQEW